MPRRVLTEEQMRQWLLENVRIRDDCRIWAGAVDSRGQPVVMWDGKNYKARRLLGSLLGLMTDASHLSWTFCGDRRCLAPEHQRYGTMKEMCRAMKRRGVYVSGAHRSMLSALGRAKHAKMPITERRTVLRLLAEGATHKEVAARYGVHFTAVSKAMRSWERATGSAVDLGGTA
ncbi:MAG TPA: hypothetical protein PKC22_16980 [Rhodocyclaceae bacterium]|nr:hypothetical protein [Rhodocyclaceae bacterium]